MYPQGDLIQLQRRKAALRRRIAATRAECAEHAAAVAQPLRWLDQAIGWWRQLQPFARFAGLPIGLWVMRAVTRRFRVFGSLLRWGPLVFNVVRGFTRPAETTMPRGAK